MHSFYAKNKKKLRKGMDKYLSLVASELENISGRKYPKIFEEIWDFYEKNLLENFPYIGGDKVSGTKNLTGAYCFVAMGEIIAHPELMAEEIKKFIGGQTDGH